jgi:hypothetical protein
MSATEPLFLNNNRLYEAMIAIANKQMSKSGLAALFRKAAEGV